MALPSTSCLSQKKKKKHPQEKLGVIHSYFFSSHTLYPILLVNTISPSSKNPTTSHCLNSYLPGPSHHHQSYCLPAFRLASRVTLLKYMSDHVTPSDCPPPPSRACLRATGSSCPRMKQQEDCMGNDDPGGKATQAGMEAPRHLQKERKGDVGHSL